MKFTVFRDRVEYVSAKLPPYEKIFQPEGMEQDPVPAVTYVVLRGMIEWMADYLKSSNLDSAEVAVWDRKNRDGGWTIQARMIPKI